jgi:hypothetical protein
MNQIVITVAKIALLVIVLLRLVFVIDFSQFGLYECLAIELIECESEDSEKEGMEKFEKFCSEINVHGRHPSLLNGSFNHGYVGIAMEAHIREIVPPPPKG